MAGPKKRLNMALSVTKKKYVKKPDIPRGYAALKLTPEGMIDLNTSPDDERAVRANENQQNSPILRLPPELRHKIFTCVFEGLNIHIVCNYYDEEEDLNGNQIAEVKYTRYCRVSTGAINHAWIYDPEYTTSAGNGERFRPISLVCRQFYNDTALLPFRACSFLFLRKWAFIYRWLPRTRDFQRREIANIYLSLEADGLDMTSFDLSRARMEEVAHMTNVKKLYLLTRLWHQHMEKLWVIYQLDELEKVKKNLGDLFGTTVQELA